MSDNTLERANFIAVRAQSLQADIERSAKDFRNLATQEKDGNLSGRSGTGAIYAVLMQKADELDAIRQVVDNKSAIIEETFQLGNTRFDYYQGIRNIHPDLFWSLNCFKGSDSDGFFCLNEIQNGPIIIKLLKYLPFPII